MSHEIAANLQGFVTEPDSRNAECALPPIRTYEELGHTLLCYRRQVREYLACRGDYTLLPGGSLALGDSSVFMLSNPNNPYYQQIKELYGTNVVTASTHINIGVEDAQDLIRASRVIRAEAALFLALSASSPFLDGEVTGHHSTRWHRFPQTPPDVPFFRDHANYITWVESQLAAGSMHNIRHLWLSARPNGIGAPQEIQRMELRICDRIDDLPQLLAIIALLEARVHQVLEDPSIDPLDGDRCEESQLRQWTAENEEACARNSLEARVTRWDTGAVVSAHEWICEILASAKQTASEHGFAERLTPIDDILRDGNTAQQWLRQHAAGASVGEVYAEAVAGTEENEARQSF
jgi:predicted glutamate--cysteine ligase